MLAAASPRRTRPRRLPQTALELLRRRRAAPVAGPAGRRPRGGPAPRSPAARPVRAPAGRWTRPPAAGGSRRSGRPPATGRRPDARGARPGPGSAPAAAAAPWPAAAAGRGRPAGRRRRAEPAEAAHLDRRAAARRRRPECRGVRRRVSGRCRAAQHVRGAEPTSPDRGCRPGRPLHRRVSAAPRPVSRRIAPRTPSVFAASPVNEVRAGRWSPPAAASQQRPGQRLRARRSCAARACVATRCGEFGRSRAGRPWPARRPAATPPTAPAPARPAGGNAAGGVGELVRLGGRVGELAGDRGGQPEQGRAPVVAGPFALPEQVDAGGQPPGRRPERDQRRLAQPAGQSGHPGQPGKFGVQRDLTEPGRRVVAADGHQVDDGRRPVGRAAVRRIGRPVVLHRVENGSGPANSPAEQGRDAAAQAVRRPRPASRTAGAGPVGAAARAGRR